MLTTDFSVATEFHRLNLERHMLRRLKQWILSPKVPSLGMTKDQWDREYASKKWDYLESLPEMARYSVIVGYLRYLEQCRSVLEIGCGTGLLVKRLGETRMIDYTGVDLSQTAIEYASRLSGPSTRFFAADGRAFSDGKRYDVVVFNETLYYFDDCISVLSHYVGCLSPGGFFIVSMVTGDVSASHWMRIDEHFLTLDAVRLRNSKGITWDCRLLAPLTSDTVTVSLARSD